MYRPAESSDIDAMRGVEIDAGEMFRVIGMSLVADDDPPTREALLAYVSANAAWVAEIDGSVIGYATASLVDREGHLDQVSISAKVAGRGIGRALIEAVVAWTRAQELAAVTLTTFRDVVWNAPYYERLGFVVVDEEDIGGELAAIRRTERVAGLDAWPRVAMRLQL
jgi:N-acetylglutamate synthase-like GNAT family acetyltransferase